MEMNAHMIGVVETLMKRNQVSDIDFLFFRGHNESKANKWHNLDHSNFD